MLHWHRLTTVFCQQKPTTNARTAECGARSRLELLEDRRLLTLAFDPSFTHVANPPIPITNWPEGHVGVFVPGEASAMVQQPLDGKIVMAGWGDSPPPDGLNFGIVRVNANGVLDPTFDGDGIINVPFYGFGRDRISAIALDTISDPVQTRIVVAGTAEIAPNQFDFALMRFNEDGTRDTSFQGSNDEPGEVVSPAWWRCTGLMSIISVESSLSVQSCRPLIMPSL
jgi:uncharacterized delta-60 repeat protein